MSTFKHRRVMVVDDDVAARSTLALILGDQGYAVETAPDGFRALAKLNEFDPELVLADFKMPGMDGLELLRKVRELDPLRAVVLVTAHGAIDQAVTAMREGAVDYLTKPLQIDSLLAVVRRALERWRFSRELPAGPGERDRTDHAELGSLIGVCPAMRRALEVARHVATSDAPVLISGETGTGKDALAEAIAELSGRTPLVKRDASATADLELDDVPEKATLLLGEPSTLSIAAQAQLSRFIEQRPDVRILSTSRDDLDQAVSLGTFRGDLLYRLNVIPLILPPLRARREEVAPLAVHLAKRIAARTGARAKRLASDALEALVAHTWPGNVRELESVLVHATATARTDTVYARDLTLAPAGHKQAPAIPGATLAQIERYAILRTLEHSGGCKADAARILGISQRKIQYKIHEYSDPDPAPGPLVPRESPRSP